MKLFIIRRAAAAVLTGTWSRRGRRRSVLLPVRKKRSAVSDGRRAGETSARPRSRVGSDTNQSRIGTACGLASDKRCQPRLSSHPRQLWISRRATIASVLRGDLPRRPQSTGFCSRQRGQARSCTRRRICHKLRSVRAHWRALEDSERVDRCRDRHTDRVSAGGACGLVDPEASTGECWRTAGVGGSGATCFCGQSVSRRPQARISQTV